MKLLGRITSVNVRKVAWTADLLGIAYEREDWGLPLRDPREAAFLALNPNAQVPVIIDDGFVLWESNAIMRYLAETRGSALWPKEPKSRALVDQWLSWQVSELNPAWSYAVQALLRRTPGYDREELVADSIRRWSAKMAIVEGQLQGGSGYLVNGALSLADIALALATHRWVSTPFDHPVLPAVEAHYHNMRETAAGRRYLGSDTP